MKTVILDVIKNNLKNTVMTDYGINKTFITNSNAQWSLKKIERLNERDRNKKVIAFEFLRRNPQYEGKKWDELYNLHNKDDQLLIKWIGLYLNLITYG